jgi:tetratricopeptide (TPR) repeat protein
MVTRNTQHVARAWLSLLFVTLSALAYLGLRISGLGYLYLSQPDAGLPIGNAVQHLLLVCRSIVRYFQVLIWPWGNLSPIQYSELPVPSSDPIAWVELGLVMLLVGSLVWLAVKRRPVVWMWAAFGVSLLPVINLIPLEIGGGAIVCERFAYLPSFFFLAAVGDLLPLPERGRAGERVQWPWQRAGIGLMTALAVAYLAVVLVTVPHWRDDVTLWEWAAQRAPQSDLPWVNLAVQAGNRGEGELALDYANHALALNPDNATAHDTAGLALFLLGDYAGAEQAFRNGLALEPDNAHLWSNLAGAVREQGRLEEASHILIDEALARDTTLWTAHLGLGLCHLAGGRPDLAVEPFRQAVHYQPQTTETWVNLIRALVGSGQGAEALETMARSPFDSPEGWFHLGNDLLASGQAAEALRAYDPALAGSNPAAVHLQQGLAFVQLGDLDAAEATLRAGLALAPEDGHLHNNLGMVLRDRGDLDKALGAFETAWHLLPDSAVVASNLAQTYQALGRTNEAAQWQAIAEQLAVQK